MAVPVDPRLNRDVTLHGVTVRTQKEDLVAAAVNDAVNKVAEAAPRIGSVA